MTWSTVPGPGMAKTRGSPVSAARRTSSGVTRADSGGCTPSRPLRSAYWLLTHIAGSATAWKASSQVSAMLTGLVKPIR